MTGKSSVDTLGRGIQYLTKASKGEGGEEGRRDRKQESYLM
jgi:hypothetical protein